REPGHSTAYDGWEERGTAAGCQRGDGGASDPPAAGDAPPHGPPAQLEGEIERQPVLRAAVPRRRLGVAVGESPAAEGGLEESAERARRAAAPRPLADTPLQLGPEIGRMGGDNDLDPLDRSRLQTGVALPERILVRKIERDLAPRQHPDLERPAGEEAVLRARRRIEERDLAGEAEVQQVDIERRGVR